MLYNVNSNTESSLTAIIYDGTNYVASDTKTVAKIDKEGPTTPTGGAIGNVSGSNPTVYSVAKHIGMAICGLLPDGRNIVSRAKLEASTYYKNYGVPISGQILAERLSIYVHAHTCHWGARPFGCSVFISSYDTDKKYHLYMLENNGNFFV